MPDQDPWEEAAKQFKAPPGAPPPAAAPAAPAGNDDWKLWQAGPQATSSPSQPSMLQNLGSTASDVIAGAGKGLASTIHNAGQFLHEHVPMLASADNAYWKMLGKPAPTEQEWSQGLTPSNTAQKVGHGLEQAGEFLIPGGAEEQGAKAITSLAPKAKMLAPIARTGLAALGAGTVNAAQGGSFETGAATGSAGGLIGEGARAVAPGIAESALGIRKQDRFFGRTPGEAILNDTKGIRPATIADNASATKRGLTSQLENLASQSNAPVSMMPARKIVDDAMRTAEAENNPAAIAGIKPLQTQLSTNVTTGMPLAPIQSPRGLLNLKRGLGDAVSTWNPERTSSVNAVGKRAYHAMDEELDRVMPAGADLNQRISSLIPVAKRAESADLGAGVVQRGIHRVAAHTGAAASGLMGGYSGYKTDGLPGAVIGGTAGFLAPELLTSPTTQMMVARGLASPATRRIVRPLATGGLIKGLGNSSTDTR